MYVGRSNDTTHWNTVMKLSTWITRHCLLSQSGNDQTNMIWTIGRHSQRRQNEMNLNMNDDAKESGDQL